MLKLLAVVLAVPVLGYLLVQAGAWLVYQLIRKRAP
jgi:hypothetical protein